MINKKIMCLIGICLSLTSCSLGKTNTVTKRDANYMTEMSVSLKGYVSQYFVSLIGTNVSEPSDVDIDYVNESAGLNSFSQLKFKEEKSGSSKVIKGYMNLVVNLDDYESQEFRFESSPFYGLCQIFGAGNLDYSKFNQEINKLIKSKKFDIVKVNDGQFENSIEVTPSELKYVISINP